MLVGQPELQGMLRRPDLRQLKQRIALCHHLRPFDRAETRDYVEDRLRKAGFTGGKLFKRSAWQELFRISEGTPRLINNICDSALLLGYARQKTAIDGDMIREVARDLDLDPDAEQESHERSGPHSTVEGAGSRRRGLLGFFRS
jgi:general secretion pathway protein A